MCDDLRMHCLARLVLGVVLLSAPGIAQAEQPRSRVVQLPTVQITGRIQTPLASVEISRAEPKLTLSALRPTFTDRISSALAHDPY